MSSVEERLEKLEAHNDIKSCLTRYCRALDWVDEELLKTLGKCLGAGTGGAV